MRFFCFLLILVLPHFCWGQLAVDQTIKAINSGNITEASSYFDKTVDVTLNNEQSTYSQAQATFVLKDFFNHNQVKLFTVKHKGSPANNSSIYIIGELQTKEEKDFRIYLFFKQIKDSFLLQEIRIEQ